MDGVAGAGSTAFLAAPDAAGRRHSFAISWAGFGDGAGGVLVRAAGFNSWLVQGVVDNIGVYKIMYRTMLGVDI
ncbi:hypothetical protein DFJ74DRAFT_682328 [Hyaloraphidium curvatum]|nr:hypothetical protein DFJ74DRAFT_682328 [Hyaloraphidium curvatum]